MREFATRVGISVLVGLVALAAFLEYALWRADNYATTRIRNAADAAAAQLEDPYYNAQLEDPQYKAALDEYERRKAIYDDKLKRGEATIEDWSELMKYYPMRSR